MAQILSRYSKSKDLTQNVEFESMTQYMKAIAEGYKGEPPGDFIRPYTFRQWYNQQVGILPGQEYILYNDYLKGWYSTRSKSNPVEINTQEAYLNLLNQLDPTFKTEDDKNILKGLDFTKPADLLDAVPLYVNKLKNIAKYISLKRDTIKKAKLKYNMSGSNQAIEKLFYEYLLKAFTKNKNINEYTVVTELSTLNSLPDLSAVNDAFSIEIEEVFDDTSYFDKNPSLPVSSYYINTSASNAFLADLNISSDQFDWLYSTGMAQLCADNPLLWVVDDVLAQYTNQDLPLSAIDDVINNTLNEYNQIALAAKYIGENQYIISGGYYIPKTLSANYSFAKGNNWFYWPSGGNIYDNNLKQFLAPISLSATDLNKYGTASLDYKTADKFLTIQDNNIHAAWLQKGKRIPNTFEMEAQIFNGENTFAFPYPGYGISGEDIEWEGREINNYDLSINFLEDEYKEAIYKKYWSTSLPPSVTQVPISLMSTNLIVNGAYADKSPWLADMVMIRPRMRVNENENVYSGTQESAFLYKVDKTDIPITKGNVYFRWPYETYTDKPRYTETLNEICDDTLLSNIPMQAFAGAVAGDTLENSDVIYELDGPNGNIIAGAWLSGQSISTACNNNTLVTFITQPALSIIIPSSNSASFIWNGEATNPSDVFKHINHKPECEFNKNISSDILQLQNNWKSCNCQSIWFSPFGHDGAALIENNQATDIILKTTCDANYFSIESWRGSDGKDYTTSIDAIWYKTTSGIGWLNGEWVSTAGIPIINFLQPNQKYVYVRYGLQNNTGPILVVNYSYNNTNTAWKALTRNIDGNWITTSNTSKLNFKAGNYYLYTHRNLSHIKNATTKQTTNIVLNENKNPNNNPWVNYSYAISGSNINLSWPKVYNVDSNVAPYNDLSAINFFVKTPYSNSFTSIFYTSAINANINTRIQLAQTGIYTICAVGFYRDLLEALNTNTNNNPWVNYSRAMTGTNIELAWPSIYRDDLDISTSDNLSAVAFYLKQPDKTTFTRIFSSTSTAGGTAVDAGFFTNTRINLSKIGTYTISAVGKLKNSNTTEAYSFNITSVKSTLTPKVESHIFAVTSVPSVAVTTTNLSTISSANQTISGIDYVLNVDLFGWDYAGNYYFPEKLGAKPIWGTIDFESTPITNYKSVPYMAGVPRKVGEYIWITQPEISLLSLSADNYIQYTRRSKDKFVWNQSITQIAQDYTDNKWCELLVDTSHVSYLSSILRNDWTNLDITATNIDSNITLVNIESSPILVNYYAQSPVTWNVELTDVSLGIPPTGGLWLPIISGDLIKADAPYTNVLNRHFPTYASVPYIENLYTEKDVGGFMTPKHLGLSTALSKFNKNELYTKSKNFINSKSPTSRIYRNLEAYNNDRGLTNDTIITPVTTFEVDSSWMKATPIEGKRAGRILEARNHQEFVPYQTSFETHNYNKFGVVRQSDDIKVFGAVMDQLKGSELYQWRQDVFGNNYALHKFYDNDLSVQLVVPSAICIDASYDYLALTTRKRMQDKVTEIYSYKWEIDNYFPELYLTNNIEYNVLENRKIRSYGYHTIKVTVTDVAGNTAQDIKTIFADYCIPKTILNVDIDGPEKVCTFNNITYNAIVTPQSLPVVNVKSHNWYYNGILVNSITSGNLNSISNLTTAFSYNGQHDLTVIVEDNEGNVASDTIYIEAYPCSDLSVALAGPTAVCVGTPASYRAIPTQYCTVDGCIPITNYQLWIDGSLDTTQPGNDDDSGFFNNKLFTAGNHTLSAIVTDADGFIVTDSLIVSAYNCPPQAFRFYNVDIFGPGLVCNNSTSAYAYSAFATNGINASVSSYTWYINSTPISTVNTSSLSSTINIDFSGAPLGISSVWVQLSGVANNIGFTDEAFLFVETKQCPSLGVTFNIIDKLCYPRDYTFVGLATFNELTPISSWEWKVKDYTGSVITTMTSSITTDSIYSSYIFKHPIANVPPWYNSPYVYSVSATVYDIAGNTATVTQTALAVDCTPPKPYVVSIEGPIDICNNVNNYFYTFSATAFNGIKSTINNYKWYLNNALVSSLNTSATSTSIGINFSNYKVVLSTISVQLSGDIDSIVGTIPYTSTDSSPLKISACTDLDVWYNGKTNLCFPRSHTFDASATYNSLRRISAWYWNVTNLKTSTSFFTSSLATSATRSLYTFTVPVKPPYGDTTYVYRICATVVDVSGNKSSETNLLTTLDCTTPSAYDLILNGPIYVCNNPNNYQYTYSVSAVDGYGPIINNYKWYLNNNLLSTFNTTATSTSVGINFSNYPTGLSSISVVLSSTLNGSPPTAISAKELLNFRVSACPDLSISFNNLNQLCYANTHTFNASATFNERRRISAWYWNVTNLKTSTSFFTSSLATSAERSSYTFTNYQKPIYNDKSFRYLISATVVDISGNRASTTNTLTTLNCETASHYDVNIQGPTFICTTSSYQFTAYAINGQNATVSGYRWHMNNALVSTFNTSQLSSMININFANYNPGISSINVYLSSVIIGETSASIRNNTLPIDIYSCKTLGAQVTGGTVCYPNTATFKSIATYDTRRYQITGWRWIVKDSFNTILTQSFTSNTISLSSSVYTFVHPSNNRPTSNNPYVYQISSIAYDNSGNNYTATGSATAKYCFATPLSSKIEGNTYVCANSSYPYKVTVTQNPCAISGYQFGVNGVWSPFIATNATNYIYNYNPGNYVAGSTSKTISAIVTDVIGYTNTQTKNLTVCPCRPLSINVTHDNQFCISKPKVYTIAATNAVSVSTGNTCGNVPLSTIRFKHHTDTIKFGTLAANTTSFTYTIPNSSTFNVAVTVTDIAGNKAESSLNITPIQCFEAGIIKVDQTYETQVKTIYDYIDKTNVTSANCTSVQLDSQLGQTASNTNILWLPINGSRIVNKVKIVDSSKTDNSALQLLGSYYISPEVAYPSRTWVIPFKNYSCWVGNRRTNEIVYLDNENPLLIPNTNTVNIGSTTPRTYGTDAALKYVIRFTSATSATIIPFSKLSTNTSTDILADESNSYGIRAVIEDSKGNVYAQVQNLNRWCIVPRSELDKVDQNQTVSKITIKSIATPSAAYGAVCDADDRIWWWWYDYSIVGIFDTKTNKQIIINLPTTSSYGIAIHQDRYVILSPIWDTSASFYIFDSQAEVVANKIKQITDNITTQYSTSTVNFSTFNDLTQTIDSTSNGKLYPINSSSYTYAPVKRIRVENQNNYHMRQATILNGVIYFSCYQRKTSFITNKKLVFNTSDESIMFNSNKDFTATLTQITNSNQTAHAGIAPTKDDYGRDVIVVLSQDGGMSLLTNLTAGSSITFTTYTPSWVNNIYNYTNFTGYTAPYKPADYGYINFNVTLKNINNFTTTKPISWTGLSAVFIRSNALTSVMPVSAKVTIGENSYISAVTFGILNTSPTSYMITFPTLATNPYPLAKASNLPIKVEMFRQSASAQYTEIESVRFEGLTATYSYLPY